MKIMALLMTLSLATASAFANSASAERLQDLLKMQKEISKIEGQLEALKANMDSDSNVRTGAIIVTGVFLGLAAKCMYNVKADRSGIMGLEKLAYNLFYGSVSGAGAVVAGGVAGYEHFKISLNRDQVEVLQARLAGLQKKIIAKLSDARD